PARQDASAPTGLPAGTRAGHGTAVSRTEAPGRRGADSEPGAGNEQRAAAIRPADRRTGTPPRHRQTASAPACPQVGRPTGPGAEQGRGPGTTGRTEGSRRPATGTGHLAGGPADQRPTETPADRLSTRKAEAPGRPAATKAADRRQQAPATWPANRQTGTPPRHRQTASAPARPRPQADRRDKGSRPPATGT